MQKKKRTPLDAQQSHLWIIGGGIAGMAAAAFAIRDAKVPAKNIHVFSVHDKFHRTLILSGFCLLKIAKISLNSSFFPKPIKR